MSSTVSNRLPGAARSLRPAVAVLIVQLLLFPVPAGVWLQGVVQGLLNSLIVLGMMLVYRANRVLNLAQASIGTFPAAIGVGVILFGTPSLLSLGALGATAAVVVVAAALTLGRFRWTTIALAAVGTAVYVGLGLPLASKFGYVGGFSAGLSAAVLTGWFVDVVIMQRFRRSPRLVLTVATIGVVQMFAVGALLLPRLWGKVALVSRDHPGYGLTGGPSMTVGSTVFGVNDLVAAVVAIVCLIVVAVALARTDVGMAVRASAERGDRASMLGIPVQRLEAGVWIVASVLSFLGVFLQGAILGIEISAGVGLRVLVAALAAMALGGFASLPTTLAAAVSVGVLAVASGPASGRTLSFTDAVLAVVVVAGLLARRFGRARADRAEISTWQSSVEPRRVPPELAGLKEVILARWVGGAAVLLAAVLLPSVLSDSADFRIANVVALAVLALSIVVLTGWAGQVTLGQMAFAAVGASVGALATNQWHFDVTLMLVVAGLAGAVAAVVVGAPALRWQGMFFAVTTLAFALASVNYLFNPAQMGWIPQGAVYRRPLFGTWDLRNDTHMYWFALAVLVLCLVGVAGLHRSRVGRVIRGTRDNGPGAQAYGVRLLGARITAFAVSGFLAGVAGALILYVNEGYDVGTFGADQGLNIFISSVVGGVGSAVGAVLGAGVLDGARSFLSGEWALLPSAVGVLVVLLVLPGGLAEVAYRVRDRFLRLVAARYGIAVPSLIADRQVADPAGLGREQDAVPTGFITDAPGHVQEPQEHVPEPVIDRPSVDITGERGWLSARGVDVAYDRVQVLFGVDVEFQQGAITALLGTNGAGKSTLLRAIGGVAPITGGSILFDSVDLGRLRPEEIARQGIAQMAGGQGVFPSLTVEENLRVAAWLIRDHKAEVKARTADVRSRFEVLNERWNVQAGDLSGGQQQQLALAMALLVRPKLLLIDELSLGLAPRIVEQLLEQVLELRDDGVTVVIVEQSVNVALTVADHAFFMEKGEVRFSGPAQDLLDQPDLVRAVYLQGASDALRRPATGATNVGTSAPVTSAGGSDRQPADDAAPALQADGLTVAFGGITAVNEVDLAVQPSEIVGIIGPNGAGKTTLYDLICGFTGQDAGRVRLHGRDITGENPSGRARAGLGRSFQDARLFPGLTVAETIALALERFIQAGDPISAAFRLPANRSVERAVAQRVEELIELFGLQYFRSKRVGELSTGSRRMVDLACVVAHAPDVVLLDEPSSGIAQREAEALGPVIHRLRDHLGASLLVIEHDIALISATADRLVALDQGAVVTAGLPAEVLAHPQVVAAYLGSNPDTVQRSDQQAAAGTPGAS